jgi:glycosyltransferase involved in cell wall biosynthesis
LPTSLIEAALCSIPIISENVGSAKEIFPSGKGGFLVTGDAERTKALLKLEENRNKLNEMGKNARKFAEAKFNVLSFISNHLIAYEK